MEKYSWSFEEEPEVWENEPYNTIKECIQGAQREVKQRGLENTIVYIGENIEYVPKVDVERILEDLQYQAMNDVGVVADDWEACNYENDNELSELQNSVQKAIFKWLKKYGYCPQLWNIESVKPYALKGKGAKCGEN